MSISYGWEKLHTAVHSLCGNGSQSERLVSAVVFSLIRIEPKEDLPEELQEEFEEFMKQMISTPAKGDEGTAQATINTLDEMQIKNAIEKIISLYDSVCRHRKPN